MRIKVKKSFSNKTARNLVRRARVRKKISGTSERPRLAVKFSLKTVFAQIIDDSKGVTLASAYSGVGAANKKIAEKMGVDLAKKAKDQKIKAVVFDRGAKTYSGRNAAFAKAARDGGLEF